MRDSALASGGFSGRQRNLLRRGRTRSPDGAKGNPGAAARSWQCLSFPHGFAWRQRGSGITLRSIGATACEAGHALRGGPISAGWNRTAAAIVQTSASAIRRPMLEVAGSLDSHRLPKAVAVVMALNTTARVRLDCSNDVRPARHARM